MVSFCKNPSKHKRVPYEYREVIKHLCQGTNIPFLCHALEAYLTHAGFHHLNFQGKVR